MPNDCGPILCTCTTLFDTTLPRLTVFGGARTPKGAAVLIFWARKAILGGDAPATRCSAPVKPRVAPARRGAES